MHTLKPGWTKAMVMEKIKASNNGKQCASGAVCSYLNSSGNRCAIGCFIPDGHRGQAYLGRVPDLLQAYPDLKKHMPFEDPHSLLMFQSVHDDLDASGANKVYEAVQNFLDIYVKEAN